MTDANAAAGPPADSVGRAPDYPIVVRPSRAHLISSVVAVVVWSSAIFVFLTLQNLLRDAPFFPDRAPNDLGIAALSLLALDVLLASLYLVAFLRMRIVLSAEAVTRTPLFGRPFSIARAPGQMLIVALRLPNVRGVIAGQTGRIALFDANEVALTRIRVDFWEVMPLGRFSQAFGDQRILIGEELSGKELQSRYPGTMSAPSRHKLVIALAAIVAIVAVLVGVAMLGNDLGWTYE